MADYSNLTIADDEYALGHYTVQGMPFDGVLFHQLCEQYLIILEAILREGMIEGAHATNLQGFLDFARRQLSGKLSSIASVQDANMTAYLSAIDAADKSVY